MEGFWVYGVNPVLEALRSSIEVKDLLIAKGRRERGVERLSEVASLRGLAPRQVDRSQLDSLTHRAPHQGVALLVGPFPYRRLEDVLQGEGDPLLMVLDGVEDPRNQGAIVRTAEACGLWGVVIPKRRAAGVTPAVAKASAGAVFHIPIVQVSNIAQALRRLKERGLWVVGAEASAPRSLFEEDLTGPLALVIGGEGRGIRPLVLRCCDLLVSIPMRGTVSSLNASVAAGVLMYEALRQRQRKARGERA